ncbi:MAG: hypothetical protein BGO77_06200 [Caedibacter sp. 37-49]|nr:MAG: hypothetical protein BGO77_06200 [Caedibacter sp. 37-49]
MGSTGSGKGTQSKLLSRHFGIPHISIGDIFRYELQNTQLGQLISYNSKQGNPLAPDEIAYGILVKRLAQGDCKDGFILEGFPLTLEQSKFLFSFILGKQDEYIPIELKISNEDSDNRLKLRRICHSCGEQFSVIELASNTCLACNKTTLGMRSDDSSVSIVQEKRKQYKLHIESILREIRQYSTIFTVECTKEHSKMDVFHQILGHITK